jgi:hypothetical protein
MGWDFRRFRIPTILKHADVKAFLSDMAVSHRDLNFLRPSLAVPDYGSGQRNQRQTETLLTARSGRQDPKLPIVPAYITECDMQWVRHRDTVALADLRSLAHTRVAWRLSTRRVDD